jgi:uncharacterized short protein YbdD (DUF466 family)
MLKFEMGMVQLKISSSMVSSQRTEKYQIEMLEEKMRDYNNLVNHMRLQYDEKEKRTYSAKAYYCLLTKPQSYLSTGSKLGSVLHRSLNLLCDYVLYA